MDRRTLLALVLMALVIVLTPMIFPSKRPAPHIDTTAASVGANATGAVPGVPSAKDTAGAHNAAPAPQNTISPPAPGAPTTTVTPVRRQADSLVVSTRAAKYTIGTLGAAPSRVQIPSYRNLRPGKHDSVVVAAPTGPLLRYRLAMGRDTV